MTKRLECVIDRIECGIAVLVPNDGSPVLEADVSKYPWAAENMFCTAVLCDGVISELLPSKGESDNRRRLEELFKRNKNK